eukprot:5211651-Pyramimonas_sp.AAC.1
MVPDGPGGLQTRSQTPQGASKRVPHIPLEGPQTGPQASKMAQEGSENGLPNAPEALRVASKRAAHGP